MVKCIKTTNDKRKKHRYYVTGAGKSLLSMHKIQFNFMAQEDIYTQDLSMHSASTVQC